MDLWFYNCYSLTLECSLFISIFIQEEQMSSIPKNSQPNENSLTASTREIKVIQEQKYILESAIFYKAKKACQRPQHSSSEKPQYKLQTCSFSDHNRRMGSLNSFKFVDIPLLANKINLAANVTCLRTLGKLFLLT